ncbi:MAG: ABC transporter substrate-binding protein [Burkholderiales bacterium]|nr:ABC transporter substrate-binding protein [Burkholderiales bacterium]
MDRRSFLQGAGAALGLAAAGAPAIAQGRTKVKVGYLHTLAVDGQIWTGVDRGSFAKAGVDLDLVQFTTGLEIFQAMIGGSIDMLATGAVLSNFPARGQGKAFLINNVEFATAQLWVRQDQGVRSFADLKGKKISTTTGTTAHVFLDNALRANGVDPTRDVEIVNQRMAEAVTSFVSGAVPAVALWVPFNIIVSDKVPGARMLVDASAYYPQAAIVGGWATRADYYEKNYDVIPRVIRGWVDANDYIVANPDAALEALQKKRYQQVPLADLKEQFGAQKMFTSAQWRPMYADGTVTRWSQQVTDFFVRFGNIQNPVPASKYFDTSVFLETIKG